MKILMLIDRMENGGAETHVEALSDALCEGGDRVEVFSAGGRISDRMEGRGIVQHRILPIGRSLWRFLLARRVLKKLIRRGEYDVLHVHTRTMALLASGLAGQGRRVGLIATVHAAFANSPWLSRIAFRSEKTIAVSEDLRQRGIAVFGIPAESVSVIPNGIDCDVFCSPRVPAEPRTILFASRLDEDCSLGACLLCELTPRLVVDFPDLWITIAGGGSATEEIRGLASEANTECRKLVGRDAILMLGAVDDMASVYQKNRIFVGASRAAMEAAACGCAVILCGNEGGGGILSVRRLLTDVDNLCSRGDGVPNAAWLEVELRQLLEHDRRTAHLAEIGSAWVRRYRNIREIARQTREVYRTLCDGEGERV